MQAGRELDALIAEKVMGLVLTCPVDSRYDHCVGTNRDGSSAKRNFCRWPDGNEHWIPFYSTSIEAAWGIVEKMSCPILELNGGQWECACLGMKSNPLHEPVMGIADTAPLAICLSALKAVGVEVPHD